MKTHLSLPTANLGKSVAFYETLLDAAPAKVLPDYALFVTEEPALELALDHSPPAPTPSGGHFGICVDTVDEVERAIERLRAADLVTSVQREETCCYANQTKVWANDPDGRRWEIYTVHEDVVAEGECCQA
ncbi:MAG TPA: ArsI/CadI family heavy metal resistance metalloenzyme [Candidatus Cybelea sp.]|jgi:catechol 2,3-dioxygenase-like lactoylglutathione lyase family enzyme|nr:ArsI/CadI family heavy metal resistance metalloenzyme [Candidatus Cybelea sp.]